MVKYEGGAGEYKDPNPLSNLSRYNRQFAEEEKKRNPPNNSIIGDTGTWSPPPAGGGSGTGGPTQPENIQPSEQVQEQTPTSDVGITPAEKAAIVQGYQAKKAERQRVLGERSRIIDRAGLKDVYGDTTVENETIYATSGRTGERVPIGRVRSGPTFSYDDTVGLKDYSFAPSPTGNRIYNESSGIMEVGVKGEGGRWVPESTLSLEGPAPVISTRTEYGVFRTRGMVAENYGKTQTKEFFVLPYDTPVVYEPGSSKQYALAMTRSGRHLESWGGWDLSRGVFVVTADVHYDANVDKLGELLLGRAYGPSSESDLRRMYGEDRTDLLVANAVGPVEKHTYATVTTPGTPLKPGFSVTYDMEALARLPSSMASVVESSKVNSMPQVGVGELRSANPIDTGRDPFGLVGWLIPRHAAVRQWFAPESYEPLMSHDIGDPFYRTEEGQAEIRNYAFITGTGLVGEAPVGMARGFSLYKDVVLKTPVINKVASRTVEFATPIVERATAPIVKVDRGIQSFFVGGRDRLASDIMASDVAALDFGRDYGGFYQSPIKSKVKPVQPKPVFRETIKPEVDAPKIDVSTLSPAQIRHGKIRNGEIVMPRNLRPKTGEMSRIEIHRQNKIAMSKTLNKLHANRHLMARRINYRNMDLDYKINAGFGLLDKQSEVSGYKVASEQASIPVAIQNTKDLQLTRPVIVEKPLQVPAQTYMSESLLRTGLLSKSVKAAPGVIAPFILPSVKYNDNTTDMVNVKPFTVPAFKTKRIVSPVKEEEPKRIKPIIPPSSLKQFNPRPSYKSPEKSSSTNNVRVRPPRISKFTPTLKSMITMPDRRAASGKGKQGKYARRTDWIWGGIMDSSIGFGLPFKSKKGRRGRR